MDRWCRAWITTVLVLLTVACAEPPSKEMNQAEGAIQAARAAGAEQYAADELNEAISALDRAQQAAGDRDYRLALNLAIDSRERAQNAAKMAVDAQVRARGDAERTLAEIATLLNHLRDRLRDPLVTRLPRRTLAQPQATADSAEQVLQEARSALDVGEYEQVMKAADGVVARLQAGLREIEEAVDAQTGRRRR